MSTVKKAGRAAGGGTARKAGGKTGDKAGRVADHATGGDTGHRRAGASGAGKGNTADSDGDTRAARKERDIIQAATAAFIATGYDGTSMEEIATRAAASKQTLYKHFTDKETLFGAVVRATAHETNDVIDLVTSLLSDTEFVKGGLQKLARRMIAMLLDEELLKLRRLIIANAERMPQFGRDWYEKGFERMLDSAAGCFQTLTKRGLLQTPDPKLAASHLFGMLLWIPMNEAMFTGNAKARSVAELQRHADATVEAFLAAYGGGGKKSQDGRDRPDD
jgi:TetR/AcrR family transcriptional repressor of mexJK operon